jgi:alpha-1,2-mannosyltransferase
MATLASSCPPVVGKAYVACIVAAAAIFVSVIGLNFYYCASQSFPSFAFDVGGVPVGRDFLNTWMGGRLGVFRRTSTVV